MPDAAPDNSSRPTSPADPGDVAALAALRAQIDDIDTRVVRLLSERGEAARAIGAIKNRSGAPVYSPDRERQVLDRIRAMNAGPFSDEVLLAIYRELMSGSLALERMPRVAFLGPPGSYSHVAARAKFGHAVELESVAAIRAAFLEVERGQADFAIVPVENSLSGGVVDTLDALLETHARVCAEHFQPIHHNLLSRVPLAEISQICSKPEVFEQCRAWLAQTGLAMKTVAVASSSRAAELAATEPGTAAIGSALAAELYGVPIQFRNIEDDPQNMTRFFVVGRSAAKRTGDDRTAIRFDTAHQAGALVEVLDAFRRASVNLTALSSRPSRGAPWQYRFYVEAQGHAEDAAVAGAIAAAKEHCSQLVVVGSFPRAASVAE